MWNWCVAHLGGWELVGQGEVDHEESLQDWWIQFWNSLRQQVAIVSRLLSSQCENLADDDGELCDAEFWAWNFAKSEGHHSADVNVAPVSDDEFLWLRTWQEFVDQTHGTQPSMVSATQRFF